MKIKGYIGVAGLIHVILAHWLTGNVMRHTVISGVDILQGHLCNKFGYSAPDDVFVDKEKHTHTRTEISFNIEFYS